MGIEPTWLAWKASALPLSYARKQINIYDIFSKDIENQAGLLEICETKYYSKKTNALPLSQYDNLFPNTPFIVFSWQST